MQYRWSELRLTVAMLQWQGKTRGSVAENDSSQTSRRQHQRCVGSSCDDSSRGLDAVVIEVKSRSNTSWYRFIEISLEANQIAIAVVIGSTVALTVSEGKS